MLQLYILSKDRPEELRSTLISALNQVNKDIEIIVSDNSEKTQVSEMMHSDFSNIQYINRSTLLSPFGHIKTVIEEATAEFIMIFHDDDILKNTHVSNILLKFKQYPDVVAVASNGTFFGDSFLKNREIMQINNEVLIKSPVQLFQYYLGLYLGSQAPFPGYIYRTSIMKKVNKTFYSECGKHGDIQLLAKILDYGHILWLPKLTLYYRIHSYQGSSIEKIYDRNKILLFMSSFGIDLKSKAVLYYKFMYLWRWWKTSNNRILRYPRGFRERVIAKFLFSSLLYLLFSSNAFKKKILRRIVYILFKKIR